MTADYPLGSEPATPEYVLEVLRDWHGRLAEAGQADADHPPSFDTTAEELLTYTIEGTYEDSTWKGLADALNMMWELQLDREVWRTVLHPLQRHTVREITEFIAARVRKQTLRPWNHAAGSCLPAGAFLTVRSILARAGADPTRITPGTLLEPYLIRHDNDLMWRLPRIAPGRLPPVEIERPIFRYHLPGCMAGVACLFGLALGPIILGLGVAGGTIVGAAVGCLLIAAGLGGAVAMYRLESPPFVRATCGDLVTFRDLAHRLAGQPDRRRIQPSA